jgi:L-seryl-tRNA(Ser) seleniumtransferase
MSPGDEKIVADRIVHVLSAQRKRKPAETAEPPAANLSGRWDVQIAFAASRSTHTLHLTQTGNRLEGTHQGDFAGRELSGSIHGDAVSFSSVQTERYGDSLSFRFTGKVAGDTMSGELDMGEYLGAGWSATRHRYSRG